MVDDPSTRLPNRPTASHRPGPPLSSPAYCPADPAPAPLPRTDIGPPNDNQRPPPAPFIGIERGPSRPTALTPCSNPKAAPHRWIRAKGALVFVSQFALHRDPRCFTNPLAFQPERWTPQFKASLPRYAYFPFGAGPRQCIGDPLAWLEEILVLATIAQRWRLRVIPGYSESLIGSISLRPKRGMPMTLHRRARP